MKLLLSVLIAFNFSQAFAAEKYDVKFNDTETVNGKTLVLNGLGLRTKTWLRVKIYVGALYLEKKTQNVDEVLNALPKKLVMTFKYDVSAKKLIGGWNEAFGNAFKGKEAELKKHQASIDKFNSYMEDMEKGQTMSFIFDNKGVHSNIKGKAKDLIAGADFAKALISVWFINAEDEDLRDGLLGK